MPDVRIRTGVQTRIVDGVSSYRVVVVMTEGNDKRETYGEWSLHKARVEAHAKDLAAHMREQTKGESYVPQELEPGDIIQLDPDKHDWGPLLCIVDEVKSWGVTCYWWQATERGKPPGQAFYRAETGTFLRVGKAQWLVQG